MDLVLKRPLGAITRVTSLSSAATLTTTGATWVQLQPLTQDVYLTMDGSTPTSTNGFKLSAGGIFSIEITSDTVLKVIEASASAELRYELFGVYQL